MALPAGLGIVVSFATEEAKRQLSSFVGEIKATVTAAFPGLTPSGILGGGFAGAIGGGSFASNLQSQVSSAILNSPFGDTVRKFSVGQTAEQFGRESARDIIRNAAGAGIMASDEMMMAIQRVKTAQGTAMSEADARFTKLQANRPPPPGRDDAVPNLFYDYLTTDPGKRALSGFAGLTSKDATNGDAIMWFYGTVLDTIKSVWNGANAPMNRTR